MFRILQEALTNVARHADARAVRIVGTRAGGLYELVIEDDGRGMEGARAGSTGMTSMRERAALAHGRLELDSGKGAGTRIRVIVQLDGEAA